MKAQRAAIAALIGLTWLGGVEPAAAQTTVQPLQRPDPASISVPDMTFKATKSDLRNFDEYFFFHKAGVSYERAFADFDQCRINSELAQLIPPMPRFIPLGSTPVKAPRPDGNFPFYPMTGAVGAVVGFIFAETVIADAEADNAVATNVRCMTYKGYSRYGTSRTIFKQMNNGPDNEQLAKKALIAAGSAPQTEAIEP